HGNGRRVGHPRTVHYQTVFVKAGRQSQVLEPSAIRDTDHMGRFWTPVVEGAGDGNRGGRRVFELNPNGLAWLTISPFFCFCFFIILLFLLFVCSHSLLFVDSPKAAQRDLLGRPSKRFEPANGYSLHRILFAVS